MDYHKLTYQQITEKFLEFEKKNSLLSLEISQVFPWQISRVSIFLKIIERFIPGNIQRHSDSRIRKIKKILYRVFINSIFYNPYLDFQKSEVLVFESGRKYKDGEGYIDIYTHHFCQNLKAEKKNITVYESFYNEHESILKLERNIKHLDFIRFFSKLMMLNVKPVYTKNEFESIAHLEYLFKEEFKVEIDLKTIFMQDIKTFKVELSLYEKLFRVKKPKEIYIINSCDKGALIYAAKKNKIVVNELQHGLNSDKDVILNFPNSIEGSLEYFPDKFYRWNNINMFFAKLPLAKENILDFPNVHLQNMVSTTHHISKEHKTILIISQPYGSDTIQDFILSNIAELPNYNFIYKLHPAENEGDFFKFRDKYVGFNNIRFVKNEESSYMLLRKAKYVIGVYSSLLFEAAAFDCNVILLNLPGVEMSHPLLDDPRNIMIDIDQKLSVCFTA